MSSRPTTTAVESPQERRRRLEALLRKKAEKARSFPLSFAQQRLWLLDQLEPGNPVYHIPLAIRLSGVLDQEALNRTLNAVIARHESLRTKIVAIDDEPRQVIEPARPHELSVVDLDGVEPSRREVEALARAWAEVRKPFRLDEGPLFRVRLLRLAPTEHILVAVVHHIISDDWSMGVLFYEVSVLYKALHAGQASPLKELPIQYADYAVWQQKRLQGEPLQALLDYWRPKLQGVADLALPTDRPYPQRPTAAGATENVVFPLALAVQLRDVARRSGATLYMTMLAAFQTLLHYYSGAVDFAVGSPIAARVRAETEGLFGFFANTLVMRANLEGDPSFLDLLEQVKQTALGAFQHQEMPFDRLVEALNPDRDTGRHPLFQVAFVLQNAPWPDATLPELSLSPIALDTGTSKFDLTVMAREERDGLAVSAEYRTQLFDAPTIRRMLGHFRRLLEAIAADPGRKLSELTIMDADERRAMLHIGKADQRPYAQDVCLQQCFEAQARRTPDAVAVCFEDQQLTYRQLNARANRLGRRLRAMGVGPDAVVGLFVQRSLEMVVGLLGVLKAGGAYLPLDPGYPPERLAFMLDHSRAKILLAQQRLAPALGSYAGQIVALDGEEDASKTDGVADLDCLTAPEHAAYVIYTSGSTGQPKGVVIPHRAIVNHMHWMADEFPLDAHDAVLQKTPFSFDASVWEFHAPLMAGARLVMALPGGHLDPAYLARVIQKQRITILQLVPTLLQMLVAEPTFAKCASLRRIFVGGEALPQELVRRTAALVRAELCNLYGPTEAAIDATFFRWDSRASTPVVPIGRPIVNTEVYVLDARLTPVPLGVPGELYIGGPGLARGYLHRPDLTAARFVPDPFSDDSAARLYRTGDQVRWLPDGNIEFLGRVDQQVKIRGFRIELGEIEAALRKHPAVREAVVTAWDAGAGEKELAAYCVATDGEFPVGQIREHLKTLLPDYMIPNAVVALGAIPLNPSGKVDYRALPRPVRRRDEQTTYVAPRNADEEALADIWREVLHLEQVGVDDNFFALGGHSLLATQIVSRIGHRMNVTLPLGEMFQAPTIAGLAERVAAARTRGRIGRREPIAAAPRDGELPLSFTQEALWFLDQLERGRPTYTIYPTVRIRGPLDAAILERAISEIARRHEALRTRFPEVAGRPLQVIDRPAPRSIPLVDLSQLPAVERQVECSRLIAEETRRPIDLERGPLIRITLLRLSAEEHVLVAAAHHIIFDGWSLGIMARELTALYQAYRAEQPSPLPELPIQYADFAVWQRKFLQGDELEQLRAYWSGQLRGLPALELPTDYPRPAVRTTPGETLPCNLSPELSRTLAEFCRREGATPFMALLAAFQVLLARYTGQEDFAVGSPVANRMQPETEPLIGYFINMLVLRADLSGGPSFRELLRRVRQTAIDAYEHQELPLDRVVEAVKPARDPSRHPLFQAMFVLQNNAAPSLDGLGLSVEPYEDRLIGRSAYFELTLAFEETARGLLGSLNYNTDLFRAETIEGMARQYQLLLAGALAEPDWPVATLPLIAPEEQRRLLVDWNSAEVAGPTDVCIHELFESQARRTPEATALIDGTRQLSYRELDHRANQLAHYLQARGVKPDQLVAVRLPRSAEQIVALLGILKAGGAYLPLDPQLPPGRLQFTLADAQVDVVVTTRDLLGDLPAGLRHIVCLDAEQSHIAKCSTTPPPSGAASHHLAYVIYTSGSTGRPKGVLIEHRALVNYTHAAAAQYGITSADRVLQFASVSYDAHVEEIYPTLTRGAALVLRNDEMLDCGRFLRLCAEWRLTFITLPTGFWHELTTAIETERLALPNTIRLLVIGGQQALPERVAAWFSSVGDRMRLLNTYGPTETTVVATAAELSPADGREPRPPIGRALPGMRAYVLDQSRQPVPTGVRGELYLGGASLARGYLNRPETTAERFVPDPFAEAPDARMYKTGDVVRWRSDGRLEFIGRTDHQVKIRGFRIEPGEVERVLSEHPAVAEAAVVARERAPGDLQLAAYVAPRDGAAPTAADLRRFLAQRLPEFMIPAAFVPLAELPHNASGKVDRPGLPAPDWGQAAREGRFIAPETPTEQRLAGIWSEMLRVERISIYDNFFDLGGHSLLAMRLMSRIRETFSVDLPLVRLFTSPTVAELARAIDGTQAGAEEGTEALIDWDAETALDPAISVTSDLLPAAAEPKRVLLTGGTGFLGAFLLDELLKHTAAEVYCLVRAPNNEEARQKIIRNLEHYELGGQDASPRIIPVCGDLAEPRLGLTEEKYQELARDIDAIYHNGARVSSVYPYQLLKPSNVTGTVEVLRFATLAKVKPVHFVSTLSVFDSPDYLTKQVVDENEPLQSAAGLASGYGQTKCVAEQLLRTAGSRGLPIVVYRPGRIIADSHSGAANTSDETTILVKLCVELGMAPAFQTQLDMTPVDYVARAIVALSRSPHSIGRTFHLRNPQPTQLHDIYRAVRASGHALEEAPFSRWRKRVIEHGARSTDELLRALSQLLLAGPDTDDALREEEQTHPSVSVACDETVRTLQRAAVSCPVVDDDLLVRYLRFLRRSSVISGKAISDASAPLVGKPARNQSLTPLREGGSQTPLFCFHGMGGHTAIFLALARELSPGRPVYGLQALGLDPGQQPHDRIETMAAFYLNELRALQPRGPYLLAGWSMGGLIALEAAQQLIAAGETVAMAALLDTYLSLKQFESADVDDQSVLRWIAPYLNLPLAELKKLPLDRQWQRIAEQAHGVKGIGAAEIRRLAAVCRAHLAAASRYTPQAYANPAVLFPAREGGGARDRRWKSLCPQLRVEPVPGNHYTMLRKPHVQQLAARLDACLAQATEATAEPAAAAGVHGQGGQA